MQESKYAATMVLTILLIIAPWFVMGATETASYGKSEQDTSSETTASPVHHLDSIDS